MNQPAMRLDETFKYLSRHVIRRMTGYGRCCGRMIVAKNWEYCPFCGGPIVQGEAIGLRTQIEQAGMNDHLTRLDGTPRKSPLTGKQITLNPAKQCEHVFKRGVNKNKRCKRLDEHKGKHQPSAAEALFGF